MPVRSMCGIWTEAVSVTRPVRRSKAAWPPRASSGIAFCRRERISISTISAARAKRLGEAAWSRSGLRPGRCRAPRRAPRGAPRPGAVVEIDDGVLRLDVDDDLLGEVLGLLARRRDHGRDRLADIGDAIARPGSAARSAHSPGGAAAGGWPRRRARSAAVTTVAPSAARMLRIRPQATGLRTKWISAAERRRAISAVKRPRPVTSARIFAPRQRAADPDLTRRARSSARRVIARTRSRLIGRPGVDVLERVDGRRRDARRLAQTLRGRAPPESACSACGDADRPVADTAERDPRLGDPRRPRAAAAPAPMPSAKSPGTPAELGEAEAPARIENRQPHLDEHLVRPQRRRED